MLTVVTAIFGPGFRLYEPAEQWSGCRFICFTDRTDLRAGIWKIVRQNHKLPPRRSNRHVKALIHRYVDGPTLYLDSEFKLVKDPRPFVEPLTEKSCWAATKHPIRRCLFDEAAFCLLKKRVESPRLLREQVERYRADEMPKSFGLWANNILARRGDHDSDRLGERWWSEIERWSERDQVSMPYVSWKLGMMPSTIPGRYNSLPWVAHKKKRRKYG